MKRFVMVTVVLGLGVGCGILRGGNGPGPKPDPTPEPVDPGDRALLERKEIDQRAHPDAVCNDGTTPVFYVRPGTGDGARKWLVFLKGGGACGNEQTCTTRGPAYTSNKPWMRKPTVGTEEVSGILDPSASANPDFWSWNHVYVPYCTSDFWIGDRAKGPKTFDMHFRGLKVVDAVLDALSDEDVVGDNDLGDATDLLLAGSSAGAIGVIQHADRLAPRFADIEFRALADAGFNADTESVDMKDPYELWNPHIDADCLAKVKDPWECLEGFVMLETDAVQTNLFVQQSQFDPTAMSGLRPNDPQDREKAERLVERLTNVMEKQDGAFCAGTPGHMVIELPLFATLAIDGTTFAQAVGDWYFDRKQDLCVIERGAGLPDGPPMMRDRGGKAGKRGGRR
jgi:hypothetical protein